MSDFAIEELHDADYIERPPVVGKHAQISLLGRRRTMKLSSAEW